MQRNRNNRAKAIAIHKESEQDILVLALGMVVVMFTAVILDIMVTFDRALTEWAVRIRAEAYAVLLVVTGYIIIPFMGGLFVFGFWWMLGVVPALALVAISAAWLSYELCYPATT